MGCPFGYSGALAGPGQLPAPGMDAVEQGPCSWGPQGAAHYGGSMACGQVGRGRRADPGQALAIGRRIRPARCEGRRVGLARLSPVSTAGRLGPGAPAQAARSASVVKLSPQPHSAAARGLAKTNSWFRPLRTKSMVVPSTIGWLLAST